MKTKIDFTRVSSDSNGNPRYVCHFLNFITEKDKRNIWSDYAAGAHIDKQYELAISRAKKLGGRKFNNKQYGGGIVFQSYNIQDLEKRIIEMMQNLITVRFFMETGNGSGNPTPFAVWSDEDSKPGKTLSCYAHVGQHSTCSVEYLEDKKRATPKQYAPLKKELEQRGYVVEVEK